MDSKKVAELQGFVGMIEKNPNMLLMPQLKFFKEFLIKWGATIPWKDEDTEEEEVPPTHAPTSPKAEPKVQEPVKEEVISESEESEAEVSEADVESDDPDKMEKEAEEFPALAPAGEVELTDEQLDKQGDLLQAAQEATRNKEFGAAVDAYTEVLSMGNPNAMLYTKRALVLLKAKRPYAAIRDCDEALKLNPDSAKAFKIRGTAYRHLRDWEKAHNDLSEGLKLDYDDDTDDISKFVEKHWKNIAQKRRTKELKEEQRAQRRKIREHKKRKAQAQREYEESKAAAGAGGFPGMPGGMPGGFGGMPGGFGGMPGGFGGMPGMPAGLDPSMISGLLSDPDMMAALSNPKIMAALQEVMSNPAAMAKYQSDPEIMEFIAKMTAKMGGGAPPAGGHGHSHAGGCCPGDHGHGSSGPSDPSVETLD